MSCDCDDIHWCVREALGLDGSDSQTVGGLGADDDLCRAIEHCINQRCTPLNPPLHLFVTPNTTIGEICNEVDARS